MPPKAASSGKKAKAAEKTGDADDAREADDDVEYAPAAAADDGPAHDGFPPILRRGVDFADAGDADLPDWLATMFSDDAWAFPVCDAKNGHLSGQLDADALKLERVAAEALQAGNKELHTKYRMYQQEWPVLRQSVLYSRLIATALAQLQVGTDDPAVQDAVDALLDIMRGLLRDQLARATVLKVAAHHSEAGAQAIAAKLKAKTAGYLPELVDDISSLGPAPQLHSAKSTDGGERADRKRSGFKADKSGGQAFKPSNNTAKNWTAAGSGASRSSSPSKSTSSKKTTPGASRSEALGGD